MDNKMLQYNNEIDVVPLTFMPNAFLKQKREQLQNLTSTLQHLGLFLSLFAAERQLNKLRIHIVVDELQDTNTDICGIFALHFLHSIYYSSDEQCNTPKCTINTVKHILNNSFHEGSNSGSKLNTLVIKDFQKKYMSEKKTGTESNNNNEKMQEDQHQDRDPDLE